MKKDAFPSGQIGDAREGNESYRPEYIVDMVNLAGQRVPLKPSFGKQRSMRFLAGMAPSFAPRYAEPKDYTESSLYSSLEPSLYSNLEPTCLSWE